MTWCSVSGFAAACPVLCSGNGQYSKGTCQCYSGWKGAECDVPMNQCIDPSCGGHGSCIDGTCVCSAGYKGEHCEEGELRGAGRAGQGRWGTGEEGVQAPDLGSPAQSQAPRSAKATSTFCTENVKHFGFDGLLYF